MSGVRACLESGCVYNECLRRPCAMQAVFYRIGQSSTALGSLRNGAELTSGGGTALGVAFGVGAHEPWLDIQIAISATEATRVRATIRSASAAPMADLVSRTNQTNQSRRRRHLPPSRTPRRAPRRHNRTLAMVTRTRSRLEQRLHPRRAPTRTRQRPSSRRNQFSLRNQHSRRSQNATSRLSRVAERRLRRLRVVAMPISRRVGRVSL